MTQLPITTQLPVAQSSGGITGIIALLGVLVSVLEFLSIASFVGVLIIAVVSNRAEPDPTGHRPQSVYCFAVSFVSIILALFSTTLVVTSVASMIGSDGSHRPATRVAVISGLFLIVSLALLITHLRRGVELALASADPANPSRRVAQSYVAAISFVSILIVLLTSVTVIYLLLALISPDVFGVPGGRGSIGRIVIDLAVLGGGAFAIVTTHKSLVPPGFHLLGARGAASGAAQDGASATSSI